MSNVLLFNMARLAASTCMGTGNVLEYDSASNILPRAGTYKTVLAIDTTITSIITPNAMSWKSSTATTFSSSASQQPIIWDTFVFGNSAIWALATTWTCLAAGLWNISASYGISLSIANGYVQIQLYKNGSPTFLITFCINVGTAGDDTVKNIEPILLNLGCSRGYTGVV